MMERFDLCVIGGGPSGYAAAVRALDFGKKVLLAEANEIGGAGITKGALSSKTLWELAKDIYKLRLSTRGYHVKEFELVYREIMREMHEATNLRKKQLYHQFEVFQNRLYPNKFKFVKAFASFVTPTEIKLDYGFRQEIIHADFTLLATGGRPRKIDGIPIDEKTIVTSDGIEEFDDFPESMVILGAGVIGCEFATIFSLLGKTKVNLISKDRRILPFEDEDIALTIAKNLEELGVTIHSNAQLEEMHINESGKVSYTLNYKDGKKENHIVEKALISVGRVLNLENIGAEQIGLQFGTRGNLVVNDTETSIPNIHAVGDLTADICLVNVGELEGRHAVEQIFGRVHKNLCYNNISTIMFLQPEVASVGMNEQEAQKKGIPYRVAKYSYEFIGRALAMRSSDGFFKILVTDDDEMRILGIRVLGQHASSTVQGVALLIAEQKGIDVLADLIHPHPSITEGLQDCVRMLKGTSIFKPAVFDKLHCYRVVNGVKMDYMP